MDSFTENLLSRARERQRLLEDYNCDAKNGPVLCNKRETLSQPNLSGNSPSKSMQDFKNNSEDNVRVEVQIEEEHDCYNSDESAKSDVGLRQDAKNRLNRLGKLYAGGEDANISSPIHQTEAKFLTDETAASKPKNQSAAKRIGLKKLADLANSINQFEDDLTSVSKGKEDKNVKMKKSWKPPAPQPPEVKKLNVTNVSTKPKAPNPPTPYKDNQNKDVKWDKKVLDSLESQGFTRTESSSRLVYKYNSPQSSKNEKENVILDKRKDLEHDKSNLKSPSKHNNLRTGAIADKAALFELSPNRIQKDPALLSVSERKALFEQNKGKALIPKAPFAMATPMKTNVVKSNVKNEFVPQAEVAKKETVIPKAQGIASTVAALFETKNTISQEQIENNVREQRRKEMDVLLNRFHKNTEVVNEDIECEEDVTEETAMIDKTAAKVVSVGISNDDRRSSGSKRCSKADSPKVAAVLNEVKRIKVSPQKTGRLYPSLTDIESVTETENETRSPTPNENSSSENSFAESDDANTSFGRDILQAVCKNQTPQKRQILNDSTSDLSDVLDDMDDYIDEALAYNDEQTNGPTPPKQGRKSPIESSHSFHYKSFQSGVTSPVKKTTTPSQVTKDLPTYVIDGDNVLPLTHTVSFYRKQQSQASNTPVKQISRQPLIVEETPKNYSEEQEQIRAKIAKLKNEVAKQELIISQTSQALNLCNSTPEFMGSTEQVEAERVLLLATHRRQAAMHERQRLEVEQTMRPQRQGYQQSPLQKGTLTISKIVLPLKQKYVTALAAAGGKGHHVVCLVKYAEQVLPTQLVSTIASTSKNLELELNVPGVIKLENVSSDFPVTFEVYCLQAQEEVLSHEVKYHIKKPNVKLTPKKSKQDSRLIRPLKESPAGPQVVRSPTFALMGYVVFSVQAVSKKQWSLNNTPSMSPLEGIVEMCVSCQLDISIEHRGFLTMFEDVSGFGAWHRRWCLLRGDTLSYWKYPDDEKKTPPINSISLSDAITTQVGPVSREICARLHTFLIETERNHHPNDKDSLVMVRKGSKTIIRHLLSADTKEERIEWCNKFNSALSALGLWRVNRE